MAAIICHVGMAVAGLQFIRTFASPIGEDASRRRSDDKHDESRVRNMLKSSDSQPSLFKPCPNNESANTSASTQLGMMITTIETFDTRLLHGIGFCCPT